MNRPLRLGLIGLGAISPYYLAAAARSPRWDLVAVCDPRPPRRAQDPAPRFDDHRDLLRTARPDAVVVAVPNHAHLDVCTDALNAGVPVCVEKPLALTPAQGRTLADLAEARSVPLMTAFHRRYNAAVRALAARTRGQRVSSVRVRYLERIEDHLGGEDWYLDPARCGGGCLADNGPNAFDVVRQLLPDTGPGLAVDAAELHRDASGTDRRAVVLLRCGDTAVRVDLDWSFPGERKDVEAVLADGRVLHADMLAGHPGFKNSLWHEYEALLAEFAGLAGRTALPSPGAHGGLASLDLVAASYAAADGGHRAAADAGADR
ncbi:Gfo/Idh/MocA family protein [Streptomyces sp. NPDC050560]|uniref:Gfo/Idh/MocA family protein n=1 Tax=Streptomyces sp. NPDC050560 TaxID=3365630 RepID=UPI0037B501B8